MPSTLTEFEAPVNICGDIHGQYSDLLKIFEVCGLPYKHKYLFLGDYVDRGRHSLEVIVLLLALKVQFPKHFFLLRGNHEVRKINSVYGFKDELIARYPAVDDWLSLHGAFNDVFAEMPLAAVVSGKILCMHAELVGRYSENQATDPCAATRNHARFDMGRSSSGN
uniref:Serine/threonine-protein phosphatase n=1 Tax=Ditylenchus dipsaci TaxID=166011 RepID=A0A915E6H4_9BILA